MAYVHVYTGNGKGKTTAAVGLALRTLGNEGHVAFYQFLKDGASSEITLLRTLGAEVRHFGTGRFVDPRNPSMEDKRLAAAGFVLAADAITSGEYDLVVMDEACVALSLGLLDLSETLRLLSSVHGRTEVVLTGRDAPQQLIDRADLVTVMQKVKHYFDQGIPSRKGIES